MQTKMNLSVKEKDKDLVKKVSEFDRRNMSNLVIVAVNHYAQKIGYSVEE